MLRLQFTDFKVSGELVHDLAVAVGRGPVPIEGLGRQLALILHLLDP